MLKRKGQPEKHTVPHYAGRLNHAENEAYQAAVGFVQSELADLATISEALGRIENTGMAAVQSVDMPTEILVGKGECWQVRRCLMKLSQSEVALCQKGTEFAIVERYPENSAYAQANGKAEVMLSGNDQRQLLQDYVQNERQALHLLAADLTAKVNDRLTEQHPKLNCERVVQAISQRCTHELNPKPLPAETITPVVKAVRGVKA